MRVLAGDVGGTNARLAVIEVEGDDATLVARRTVPVAEHEGLEEPLAAFVAEHGPLKRGCLGVAGKIVGRRIEGVNSAWTIDADSLEAASGLERLVLVNDFHAAARGLALLGPDDVLELCGGEPEEDARVAILGAGTGLGQAFVLPGTPPTIVGTEGGHRDFGPRTPLQDRLLVHMRQAYGRVSTERVLSGPGLAAIYRFLVAAEGFAPNETVEATPEAHRPAAVTAAADEHATCSAALDLFVEVYGAEASNVAVTALATGGVYVAGGIAPRILGDRRRASSFRAHFEDKGRFSDWVKRVPVWLVTNGDLGLLGAAAEAAL